MAAVAIFAKYSFFFLLNYREKPKVVKPTGNSDGPDAKKAKIDPNETVVMKKVDDLFTSPIV